MRRATPLFLSVLIFVFDAQRSVIAASNFKLATDDGIQVRVESFFEEIPPGGYLPVKVAITNQTSKTFSYNVTASSTLGYGIEQTVTSTATELKVEANQSRTVDLLVPLIPSGSSVSVYRQTQLIVLGPGVRDGGSVSFPSSSANNSSQTTFTAFSADLALRSWGPLRDQAQKDGKSLFGTQFDPDNLPTDWRGLSGLTSLWITDNELDRLAPAQRAALDDWIHQGGHLEWVLAESSTRTVEEFTDPALGTITLHRWNGTELPTEETLATIATRSDSPDRFLSTGYVTNWKLNELVGRLRFPVALLVIFVLLFAITVGPVNLFYFARPGRRQRLFWTTPLISIVASILLGAIIWFQDGSGGSGQRNVLAVLLPGTNQMLIRQEQISRTGLLIDRNFTLTESAFVAPITISTDPIRQSARNFEQSGKAFAGQWFNSRSVQGQYLEAIVPTRARIELVETASDGTPTLLSSVPYALDDILYTAPNGSIWQGGPLRTGERITLTRASEPDVATMRRQSKDTGPLISKPWNQPKELKGAFQATAQAGPYLETLPTIRWTNHQSLLMGQVQ